MGMTSGEFWDSTAREFFLRMKAFFDYQTFLQNQEWQRIRWQTTILVNIKLPKAKQIKPQDLFKFDFEQKPQKTTKPIDPIEMAETFARWDQEEKEKVNPK